MSFVSKKYVKKVLFFNHTATLGGAGISLYRLIDSLKPDILPVVVLQKNGPLANMLRAKNIQVYIEPRIKPLMSNTNSLDLWNPFTYFGLLYKNRSIRLAEDYCRQEQPDIVHINTSVLMHLSIGGRKACVPKIILHVREHWNVKWWDPRGWGRQKLVTNCIDNIIAKSETSSLQFGFAEKTNVIYDWPDFESRNKPIDIRTKYDICSNKKIILAMGGRSRIKGAKEGMLAMRNVNDPDAVLFVLGGRVKYSRSKRRLRKVSQLLHFKTNGLILDRLEKELGNKVIMAGAVQDVKSIIDESSVVICPFMVPHFAMPALEAGCLGKPVVASDTGHASEIIINNKTGIIVPIGDIDKLSAAINKLLLSPDEMQEMGAAAQLYIHNKFNKKQSVSDFINIFNVLS